MNPQENSPNGTPASAPKPDAAGIGRDIVLDAERMGLTLRIAGENIKASPVALLTPAIRWVLKTYKADVLAALRFRDLMPVSFRTSANARGIPLDAAMNRYGVTREPDRPAAADAPPAWVEKPKPAEQQLTLNAA